VIEREKRKGLQAINQDQNPESPEPKPKDGPLQ
jgi:hypothetical protein